MGGRFDDGEDSDDDCRSSGLTASFFHRATAPEGCERADSRKTSLCRNPCLHPYLMFLEVPEEVVATSGEELDWVIQGIS